MRSCRDHAYRIRDCESCDRANPPRGPLIGLRPVVDSDGLVTFRALSVDEMVDDIIGSVRGEVQA